MSAKEKRILTKAASLITNLIVGNFYTAYRLMLREPAASRCYSSLKRVGQ